MTNAVDQSCSNLLGFTKKNISSRGTVLHSNVFCSSPAAKGQFVSILIMSFYTGVLFSIIIIISLYWKWLQKYNHCCRYNFLYKYFTFISKRWLYSRIGKYVLYRLKTFVNVLLLCWKPEHFSLQKKRTNYQKDFLGH